METKAIPWHPAVPLFLTDEILFENGRNETRSFCTLSGRVLGEVPGHLGKPKTFNDFETKCWKSLSRCSLVGDTRRLLFHGCLSRLSGDLICYLVSILLFFILFSSPPSVVVPFIISFSFLYSSLSSLFFFLSFVIQFHFHSFFLLYFLQYFVYASIRLWYLL